MDVSAEEGDEEEINHLAPKMKVTKQQSMPNHSAVQLKNAVS